MSYRIPAIITDYFQAANGHDAAGAARCFDADGTVRDEGKVYQGPAAIGQWAAASSAQYQTVIAPVAARGDGPRTEVDCQVSGNFPGSPVQLQFRFTLAGARIAALEITA